MTISDSPEDFELLRQIKAAVYAATEGHQLPASDYPELQNPDVVDLLCIIDTNGSDSYLSAIRQIQCIASPLALAGELVIAGRAA